MFRQTELVLDLLDKEYPDAGTQLNYHTLFQLLVAVVLSAHEL
jgi:endonuclease III